MESNGTVKILLVDDRAENLFALEVILSDENYLCVRANSGKEALNILSNDPDFAIILMDVQMPMMDGFETVELIRQKEKLEHVPIIFLTASMDSSVQIFRGYLAGAVDYLTKPFSPAILKAKVAVFVDLYKKNRKLLVQAEEMETLNRNVTIEKLLSKYTLSIIEANHDPLFVISPEGKITDFNHASIKVTEVLSRNNLIGTNFFDYFTDPDKAREGYQQVFAKGFVSDYPLTIMNSQRTNVLFNGAIYKDDRGNVLGGVLVARDITDQKRFEDELIEKKYTAERERQIAEDAVKAKQLFLLNMSNEIRIPIKAIIGFTKVLLKTDLSAKQREYLSSIKMSGDDLIVLINNIPDHAKVDAGENDI